MTEFELQKLLHLVALNNNVSVKQVIEEIQAAINYAYENPTLMAMLVPRKDSIPTLNEFIEYLNQAILQQNINPYMK